MQYLNYKKILPDITHQGLSSSCQDVSVLSFEWIFLSACNKLCFWASPYLSNLHWVPCGQRGIRLPCPLLSLSCVPGMTEFCPSGLTSPSPLPAPEITDVKEIRPSMDCCPTAFPGGKEPACQCSRPKRHGFNPWVRKIPWRRAWHPTPVFLPGESHGQRSLVGYNPWGSQRVRHDWAT